MDSECLKYPKHFCCRQHYFEWQTKFLTVPKIKKVCSKCGKEYFKRASSGIRPLSFCTRKCQHDYFHGEKSPTFVDGKMTNNHGYVLVLTQNHPRKIAGGYVYEHILLAENILGRFLNKGEIVHHINGNKSDNNLENLVVLPNQNIHCKIHKELRTKTQSELIGNYKSLAEMSKPFRKEQ